MDLLSIKTDIVDTVDNKPTVCLVILCLSSAFDTDYYTVLFNWL